MYLPKKLSAFYTRFLRKDRFYITSHKVINNFIGNPDNSFLVSFPRTGSHWLRMLMELYFEKPSLVRIFYYPEREDYLTLHTHDLDLDVTRAHVIYLYREPISTIYSQMQYHKNKMDDREMISFWSGLYSQHLDKWLHLETFTQQKTIVRYDRLRDDLPGEFAKICAYFGETLNQSRLQFATEQITKKHVKQKTLHDPKVVNLDISYKEEKNRFKIKYGNLVWRVLLYGREYLRDDF